MNTYSVDVAVIGAGTAGLAAYRAARSHGKRVVLIEGGPYGTTCARVGCMPSKLMIAAAEAAHVVADAPSFGIHPGPAVVNGIEVMARVRSERDRFVGFVLDGVERIPREDRLQGHARFASPTQLRVDDHTVVNAKSIVIATGSSPYIPPALRPLGDRLVTNDEVFDWTDLPKSVVVVGTGVIGLEVGQALHRLGVRVVVLGRGVGLANIGDPAVLAAAREAFSDELDLQLNVQLVSAEREGGQAVLRYTDQTGALRTETVEVVLAAAGRVPNVKELGIEHAGIALDAAGLPIFNTQTMQCGSSAIFIAGDANDERPLLHEAADQGRIAGDNAGRFPEVLPGLRRTPLAIAFTDPQIAAIGRTWRTLVKGCFIVGEVSFANQGRSRVMRQNRGLLRVYAEPGTGRFIGAEIAGPRAEHLAHLLAWACQTRMTIVQMLEMPFYHPVIEEGLRTALRDAEEKLLHGLPEIEHCTDCTPGM
ncbi:MAG: dihydrolipoyl dehydrogenase [Herminiimonas sp.]|nr:dihydrolipoyl dehydrogenase [Herminiimonas sp.]MDB5852265.1 dihydrolipoyl dehydrogenase [Herminiimonas sp.]